MDPTTTLMAFMLQTSSHARSVQLIGSWDNFSKRYPMEKDARRGHREWRGCYSFKDIICDGDFANSAKRSGGLKMGHTYYYYYEIDDGIEIHDPTRPFTTACQYLPGQPVNFLWVPVEESPLRERSASVGATGTDIKTMNPADKHLTPRAPPPTPKSLPRLNTSPGVVARNRGARSTSPVPRSPWSARVLFGLKSPISAAPNNDRRLSPSRSYEGDAHISYPTLVSSSDKRATALSGKTGPGETSSPPTRNPAPRDAASPNLPIHSDKNSLSSLFISIPHDSFEEEFEDNDNFASTSHQPIDDEKSSITSLSPPPPKHLTLAPTESKSLPQLPEDASSSMVPSPLHVLPQPLSFNERMNPKSHFSIDSITTSFASLAGSQFDSSSPSAYDSTDEYVVTDDGFDFGFSTPKPPVVVLGAERDAQAGSFYGYSLPLGPADDGMDKHNRSDSLATITLEQGGARSSFGSPVFQSNSPSSPDTRTATALDELLDELGYLGDFISGA
ncbi:hypothetical protein VC83_05241 [Pseudogymnoascus destructans]|uniref:Uncharacterized protein n=2 Tax=Pseudogymnoascus destructans TaxID=655981 RepID=L8G1M6_PSED2|nr:uncharacterized protein VC83_05241 [Pseudogymnoascus destructans]ELR06699.1 hypothetical protein GMDG_00316 [Pseudogymnoascus destructans 20631-21]OAF57936.1 hypothetical protein VC83_05241 [Pseudogymnoascus destructans]